ncbi:DUF973 family protein [Metallosphaera hakonensis]|uniref:DUF973 family protein n=1 Tax=Metallosphaera hakonensis TaxID=79601 RepID=UPI0006CF5274|nr:DUF973 family protein [Metallosphaera hakonensis]
MSSQLEISGLRKLRIYALIALISILISLSLNFFLQITPLTIQQQPGAPPTAPLRELARLFGLIIPFLIVGAILQLASLIILRSGFKDLLQVRRDVGVGVTGTTLYIVSLPVLVIGALAILLFVIRSLPAFQNPPVPPTLVGPLVEESY